MTDNIFTAFDFGLVDDGVADNTPAWNAMIAILGAGKGAVLDLGGGGQYRFLSKPNPIKKPLWLRAAPFGGTGLIRDYTPASPDEPFLKTTWGYLRIDGLDLRAGDGTSGGRAFEVILTSSPANYGNWGTFGNCRILSNINGAGTGTWKWGLYLDGSDSSAGNGLRDWTFRDCWIFNTTQGPFYANDVHQFGWYGGGWFTDQKGVITGAAGKESQQVVVSPTCGGGIDFDHVVNLYASGTYSDPTSNSTIAASVTNFNVTAATSGNWSVSSAAGTFHKN